MEARCRRSREGGSPERVKTTAIQPRNDIKRTKKVQVFYYLSRNGHLQQPHLIEVSHFSNQPLRLKDFMDRLTVVRGKAMAALYSWSCKRNYRSGYVWNDLSENDVVYPAEGSEYVLKGSELVEGSSEKLQQMNSGPRHPTAEPNGPIKTRKPLTPSPLSELEHHHHQDYEEYDEEYEDEDTEKTSYTSSTTPHSRCSRGVSTEELETRSLTQIHTESTRFDSARIDSARLSTTSPIKSDLQIREKNNNNSISRSSNSKRFTDSERVGTDPAPSRNSVLLQFIACGSATVSKAKNSPSLRESAKKIAGEEEMINYMSENPRFGNLQSEEKEYFSGSIVESMRENRRPVEPALKKSNSYNEERSKSAELGETMDREEKEEAERGVKGKCIPRMKSSCSSSKQAKKP